jgi:hypothetical protein
MSKELEEASLQTNLETKLEGTPSDDSAAIGFPAVTEGSPFPS